MKDLDKQIEIKDKIYKIILSCNTKEQLLNIGNWIDSLFKNCNNVKNERIRESSRTVLKGFSDLLYSRLREYEQSESA